MLAVVLISCPGLGELPSELEAAGIELDSITDVVFTHAHPDHIWGVIDDFDEVAMTEARFYMPRQEWDYWDSDDALADMPAAVKPLPLVQKHDLMRFVIRSN